MRCAVYARFSTDKQNYLSIETQLMMCRRDIEKRGWQEVACFTDPAESAATMHRPGMQAMIAAVAAGGIDVIYADALDRLSRGLADIATFYERLRFQGIHIFTCKEGEVAQIHIGMIGTMNAEQIRATSDKTRDGLTQRHKMGKNPGGVAYGYETKIELDGNGERIRGLLQIVPAEAATVVRIFEEFAAGVSPRQIAWGLNADGIPPPRSGKRKSTGFKAPAWGPNTLTGNAARGTGILNNMLYIGQRPFLKQTYRKNPDTGRRRAFTNKDEKRAELVEVPQMRILSDTLWKSVKERQERLAQGPRSIGGVNGALPFHAQQRPRYLLTGKMTCGECGASYAKAGKVRFGCQGASKKGPTHCTNRVTIRQDELDARVLSGLSTHMMRDDVLAIFVKEYEAETRRLEKMAMAIQTDPKKELAEVEDKITTIKTAILNGVDSRLFVDELKQLQASHAELIRKIEMTVSREPVPELIHGDLGPVYRQKIGKLTDAFESEAVKAEAFERIRDLIDAVVLTPVSEAELSIDLRGAFASMLELCACDGIKNAPEAIALEALQIEMVAGVGFEPTTFRL